MIYRVTASLEKRRHQIYGASSKMVQLPLNNQRGRKSWILCAARLGRLEAPYNGPSAVIVIHRWHTNAQRFSIDILRNSRPKQSGNTNNARDAPSCSISRKFPNETYSKTPPIKFRFQHPASSAEMPPLHGHGPLKGQRLGRRSVLQRCQGQSIG